jgi:phage-related protein
MTSRTRAVSWIKAALKDFESFPESARTVCLTALTIAAESGKSDIAKPMKGMGSGVFEIAATSRRCFSGNVRRANCRENMGYSCVQEKIHVRDKDIQAGY